MEIHMIALSGLNENCLRASIKRGRAARIRSYTTKHNLTIHPAVSLNVCQPLSYLRSAQLGVHHGVKEGSALPEVLRH